MKEHKEIEKYSDEWMKQIIAIFIEKNGIDAFLRVSGTVCRNLEKEYVEKLGFQDDPIPQRLGKIAKVFNQLYWS